MAFDEALAGRVRKGVAAVKGIQEKKMFGGVAFLLHGNMLVGVHKDSLIVRIAPDDTDAALAEKDVRVFDITGRPMRGWILVGPQGAGGAKLGKWIQRAQAFVATLPRK